MGRFLTVAAPAEGLYKEKGSRFLGYLFETSDENAVKEVLLQMKELHPKATHICYAYRMGLDGENWKAADAGEPAGTAGLPILNQLRSAELTNIIGIVVRYYGGSKLGVPGLITAYKTAIADAIANAQIIEREETIHTSIDVDYESLNTVLTLLKINKIIIFEVGYDNTGPRIEFNVLPEQQQHIVSVLNRYLRKSSS